MIRPLFLLLLLLARPQAGDDVITGVERVVAVGDVHGDHEQFVAVLRSAGLLDAQLRWAGGKAHLVQTGDVLDRGADSRKAMDLLMRLEVEARQAGGAVHCLIGNHEAMNLYGDLRYLSPGEVAAFRDENSEKARDEFFQEHRKELERGLPPGKVPTFDDAYRKRWEAEVPLGYAEHRRAFSPQGKYGKWIRTHHAVLRIDGTLFLHGGISPKLADGSVRQINERVRAELQDFSKLEGGIVQDSNGPLWYRGLAQGEEPLLEAHVRKVLATYQVERIAIGHTYTDGAVASRFGGKVLVIDVGLSRFYDPQGRMACLVLEKGAPFALHRGKRVELPADSGADLKRYQQETGALDREARSR
jgi:Calcineurin-like phosphoesterase